MLENLHEMDIMDMNVLDEADMGNGGGPDEDEYDEEVLDTSSNEENTGGLKEDATNNCDTEDGVDIVMSKPEVEEVRCYNYQMIYCFSVFIALLVVLHFILISGNGER